MEKKKQEKNKMDEAMSQNVADSNVCYNLASEIYTPGQKMLVDLTRRKLGLVLNENDYLKSRGAMLSFHKLGDTTKKEIRRFSGWDEVQKEVFAKKPKSKMLAYYEMNEVLRRAGQ